MLSPEGVSPDQTLPDGSPSHDGGVLTSEMFPFAKPAG